MRPLLVVIVTVLAFLGVSTPAIAAGRLVVSPRNGATEDGTAHLRVRAGERATLTARLNGRDISKDFGDTRRGVRTLDASISHGLRHGRNVLRVTAQRPSGATLGGRPCASRCPRACRSWAPGATSARSPASRWSSTVAWPGLAGRCVGRSSTGRAAGSHRPRAARRISRRPSPGRTRCSLEAGDASDTVEVDAGSGPFVPIDTQATDPTTNRPAIQVGEEYYTPENLGGTQVLVLDRKTLARVEDNGWTTVAQVKQDLTEQNNAKLVIAVQRGAMDQPMTGAFTSIGVPAAASTTAAGPAFSAVGIPGLAAGQANWMNGAPRGGNDLGVRAQMTGYLSLDSYDNYGYIPGLGQTDFAYGAASGSPCRQGDPGGICGNANNIGYLVTVRDRFTLADVTYLPGGAYQFFSTNGRNLSAAQTQQAVGMQSMLQAVLPGDVVTVQGISNTQSGEGGLDRPLVGAISADAMNALTQEIVGLGGTRDTFNAAAAGATDQLSHGQAYVLVGWPHASPNNGAEGTGAEAGFSQGEPVALSGTLRPDNSSQYRPMAVSPSPGVSNPLDGIVLAPPDATAWPLKGGALRALAWLGDTDPRLGPDPRSAYWTQDLDQSDTNSIIEGLRDQTYPDDESFSSAQFNTAKAELIQELRWVGNTRSYLTKLSEPFASNALDGWAGAQTIADQVYNDSTASPNPVAMEWLQFTQLLLGFGGAPGQLVSRALQLGMWAYGAASDGGPGFAQVKTTADKVGTAFVTQAKTAQATLDNMGDVVVSDYAKLKEVGTWGGCNTSVTGCPASLAYSAADRKQASADVYRAIEQQAWLNLLPIGYPVFDLVPPYQSGGAPEDPAHYTCNGDFTQPFKGYPAAAYTSLFQVWNPTSPDGSSFEMYALSVDAGSSGTPPKPGVLTRLFTPLSPSGDPRVGGLGMTMTEFVRSTTPKPWSKTSCNWGD
jgi:hypothetical protein